MNRKRKYPLRLKTVVLMTVCLTVLSSIIVIFGYAKYREELFDLFVDRGVAVSSAAALLVNADNIEGYAEKGEVDSDYQVTLGKLSSLSDIDDVTSIYVYVPDKAGMNYIYDTNVDDGMKFGEHKEWKDEFSDYVPDTLAGKKLPPFITKGEDGKVFTTSTALFDSESSFVGYVCAEFPMKTINTQMFLYLLRGILISLGLIAVVSYLSYRYYNRRMLIPIDSMLHTTKDYLAGEKYSNSFDDLNIKTGDELEELADSLISLSLKNDTYIGDLHKATQLAELDSLTGLYHRNALELKVNTTLMACNDEDEELHALFMIDIVGFRKVNDECGRAVGDKMLKDIAKLIKSSFRASDVVARTGADEFAVFCPNISSLDIIRKKAENLIAIWDNMQSASLEEAQETTLSIGITLAPAEGDNFADLYRKVDKALIHAKKSGENRYYVKSDMVGAV